MKTPEDEAFDELAKRQGDWGGGYQAKRKAAADKINSDFDEEYIKYRASFPEGHMKEEWLFPNAVVPVDTQTTAALLVEIKRLIHVVGGMALEISKTVLPVQEPVAWMNPSWIDPDTRGWQSDSFESIPIEGWLPIYTAPQQRPWVGLTDEEIKEIVGPYGDTPIKGYTRKLFDQIEAKLKDKNNG